MKLKTRFIAAVSIILFAWMLAVNIPADTSTIVYAAEKDIQIKTNNKELMDLFQNYYTALVRKSDDDLAELVVDYRPVSGKYTAIDDYRNISVYSVKIRDREFVCYVEASVSIQGAKKLLPMMSRYYVKRNPDKSLQIVLTVSDEINDEMESLDRHEKIQEIYQHLAQEQENVAKEDEILGIYLSFRLGDSMLASGTAKEECKIYERPDDDNDKWLLETLDASSKIYLIGSTKDGWSMIVYHGDMAYVKTDTIEKEKQQETVASQNRSVNETIYVHEGSMSVKAQTKLEEKSEQKKKEKEAQKDSEKETEKKKVTKPIKKPETETSSDTEPDTETETSTDTEPDTNPDTEPYTNPETTPDSNTQDTQDNGYQDSIISSEDNSDGTSTNNTTGDEETIWNEEGSYSDGLDYEASENQVPVYEEPVYEEPVYEEPVYEEPVYQEPVYEEPVYQEPVYEEPVYQEPVYEEPVYQEPVYEEPVYEEPVDNG